MNSETEQRPKYLKVNPFDTGRLVHCHMLDESICHFRGLFCRFYFIFDEKAD